MRIIAGKLKGTILYLPKDKNIRPLKDLARESIFNLLNHSNKISLQLEQSNILDLYAGTGSFGLECLSRKARHVCFVENEKSAIKVLEKNIEKLDIRKKTKVFFKDAMNLIAALPRIAAYIYRRVYKDNQHISMGGIILLMLEFGYRIIATPITDITGRPQYLCDTGRPIRELVG